MTEEAKKDDLKTICIFLYAAYATGVVLQFSELTLIPGLIALIIAYILCEIKKWEAKGTPYESHLRWMSRTFWIGTGVYMPIAVIIAAGLILQFTDIGTITSTLNGDDPENIMGGIQVYMQQYTKKITMITMITMVPTTLWWLHRCWVGYKLAQKGKPIENVTTWL